MMWMKKKTPIVEFHSNQPGVNWKPAPAKKFIPQWYKDQPRYAGDPQGVNKLLNEDKTDFKQSHTVKQCIPVLDALTIGYIIPHVTDVMFYKSIDKTTGQIQIVKKVARNAQASFTDSTSGDKAYDSLMSHSRWQWEHHPAGKKQGGEIYKFFNQWTIKTPPGYSCLFVHPFHQNQRATSWEILPGVVDTDRYQTNINFPFLLDMKIGEELIIEAGSPMVQVIPFKREEYNHKNFLVHESNLLEKHWSDQSVVFGKFKAAYKDFFWQRKKYN